MENSQEAFKLTLEERDGYTYAFVEGKNDNFEISLAYWSEIAVRLKQTGSKRVLIVEDIEQQGSAADVFDLVTRLVKIGFLGKKIAFVDRYSSHQDLNDFGALVGENRGLHVKAFNDEAEAKAWLLQV